MKLRRWILIAIVAAAFAGSDALKRNLAVRPEAPVGPPGGAARIVSLAPSITEVLFELGLGDRVVGVTRYCVFPPEARAKPRIGGYYDPNYEAISAARPDLAVVLPEHAEIRKELEHLGLKTLTVDHTRVPGILASIRLIGDACGVPEKAALLHARLDARIRNVGTRTRGRPKPRVLISIGRMAGDVSMNRITVCGRKGFFEELIELAGGVNAFEGGIAFPSLSAEGLLQTNPDVIVDLWPDLKEKNLDAEKVRSQWSSIPGLKARIHVIGESYAMIPGPRVVLLLEDLARAFHPGAMND
ncbi:MAG TPA: helical backbone metal receptor [Planctomycetota bacterium]|nr:helical backbone metal receptor [Planctomycetota bacterium]